MPQPVSRTANLVPRDFRAERWPLFPESRGGFADYKKLALHGGDRFRVLPERTEIHACHEILDQVDGFRDIAE